MKKLIFIVGVLIIVGILIIVGCKIKPSRKNDLTKLELKQIEEIIDSLGTMNNLNSDYSVCPKFDFFATENFTFFNHKENEVMADINKTYFNEPSKQLLNLRKITSSKNHFSITGVVNNFICVSLVEGIENYNCFDPKVRRYKFYLVKLGSSNYEILETNEVHFG